MSAALSRPEKKRRRTFMDMRRQMFIQRIQPKLEHMFHKRQNKSPSDEGVSLVSSPIQPVKKNMSKSHSIESHSSVPKTETLNKCSFKLDKHEPEWSWWHYYKRQRKPSTATCRLCGWSIGRGAGLSDILLANHMQKIHPQHHSNRLQAEGLQKLRQLTATLTSHQIVVTVDKTQQCFCIEVSDLSSEVVQIPLQLPPTYTNNLPLDDAIVRCQLDNLLNELGIRKCRVRLGEQLQ